MKKIFKSKLFLQVIIASLFATLATAGIVGAVTTIGANISTGGTLTATATSTLNGIIVDTNKFIVEDASGNTTVGGTLGVTGVTTLVNASSTLLTVSGNSYLDGGITVATNKFTVASATGNTLVAGTLNVTGASTLTGNTSVVGTLGSIGAFNVNGYATTTAVGIIMPTQIYTGNAGCAAATVGGIIFNASKQILCVCIDGATWQAATSTAYAACF